MSISLELGQVREVTLQHGTVRYRERGDGQPILFLHGLLVGGDLWRKVVPRLAGSFRCIVPDWPMGSHEIAMKPGADLTPPGLARLVANFIEALNLEDVVLVANDTGGAIAQLVVTEYPQHIARLVLTSCDAFEVFPPSFFKFLAWAARLPGALFLLTQSLRISALRRTPVAFGWVSKRPIDAKVLEAWVRPAINDRGVRCDLTKFLKGLSTRYTIGAAAKFGDVRQPVLIAWAEDDRFLPLSLGQRLSQSFPHATLLKISDCRTFVPEDQPARLADLIARFAQEGTWTELRAV